MTISDDDNDYDNDNKYYLRIIQQKNLGYYFIYT